MESILHVYLRPARGLHLQENDAAVRFPNLISASFDLDL